MVIRKTAAGAVVLLSAGWLALAGSPAPADEAAATAARDVRDVKARPAAADSRSTPALFDPARHMRVSEVRAGMKGYGLSVFQGTKIERFDVEVLSVLKNFNPKSDVVLITCKGANLEHTGAIAGMSGSPIFLKDDQGRERMIGAFAYGWPLTKDPLAGVQPIEYMLALPGERTEPGGKTGGKLAGHVPAKAAAPRSGGAAADDGRPLWSWGDAAAAWNRLSRPPGADNGPARGTPRLNGLTGADDVPRMQPLATPLMASGVSPKLLEQFGPALRAHGLVPLQAGGAGGGGSGVAEEPVAALEPGAVMAVPVLTGDVEMTAIGTCTEVRGDRVFGFGHPFNNEGPVSLPMGSGRINGVVSNLMTSFKLGSLTQARGELTADQAVGVAGRTGATPAMVPIEVKVTSPGQGDRTYRFQAAVHPKFTPLLCGMAFGAAVGGSSDLPQFNTVDYAVDLEFGNGRTIRVTDTAVNTSPQELFQGIGLALVAASENPFERVLVKKVTGTVTVTPEVRQGQILDVNVPRLKYRPGETVKAFVTYKPFRADEAIMPVELDLPKDLPAGTYQLVVSDADRWAQDEQTTKPFSFTAETVGGVFDVLKELSAVRHDAVYVRLVRQPDGVAIGRTAMPQLPSSRRQILMASGRSNTTPFISSVVKVIPTERVMAGSAEFQIQIETHPRAEAGGAGGPHGPATRPGVALPRGGDDAKPPRTGPKEAPRPKEPKDTEPKDNGPADGGGKASRAD